MAYRDLLSSGYKPGLDVLDMILGCLRLNQDPGGRPSAPHEPPPSSFGPSLPLPPLGPPGNSLPLFSPVASMSHRMGGMGLGSPTFLGSHISPFGPLNPSTGSPSPMAGPSGREERKGRPEPSISWFDPVFDQRALSILDDAIKKGHLPLNIEGLGEEGAGSTLDLNFVPPTLAEVVLA